MRSRVRKRVHNHNTQENLSQNSEVLICPEYAAFAVRVKRAVTTSATPTVKREEPSRQTFRRYPTLKTVRKRPATYARDVLKRLTEHKSNHTFERQAVPSWAQLFFILFPIRQKISHDKTVCAFAYIEKQNECVVDKSLFHCGTGFFYFFHSAGASPRPTSTFDAGKHIAMPQA